MWKTIRARWLSALRRFGLAAGTVAMVLTMVLVPTRPVSAAALATVKATTQRMAEPTLNYTQLGTYSAGYRVSLSCYLRGQSVKGYYSPWLPNGGWDNLWYQTSDGGFVADVDISTGSNNPVTGACSESNRPATVMATTQRMTGASLNVKQSGTYGKGGRLTLRCYARGQSVKGYYSPWLPNGGWDNLWYQVTDGYWVADVDISTGSNSPVTRACGPQFTPPPSSRYSRLMAASWALENWDQPERYKGEDCTWFVSNALWEGGLPESDQWYWGIGKLPAASYNADALFHYLINHHLATMIPLDWNQNSQPLANFGDVIAYDWDGGPIDHLAMVTWFDSNYYPIVTQHTVAWPHRRWNWSWNGYWLPNVAPGAHAYLLHITY